MGSRGGSRRLAIIFLALSVVAAGLATLILFVVFRSLENRVAQRTDQRKQELVQIVRAKVTLEQGTTLNPEQHLEVVQVPRTFFLDTMIDDPSEISRRVPRERILAGEPIRTERLADPQAGTGLNALIPKGQRALQVELRGAAAVAGFINPGDYVDIIFTGNDQEKGGQHTKTLLQSKLVLAVGERMALLDEGSRRAIDAPSVTLALTPKEAQLVTHANRTGKVTLTLRNHVDVTKQEVHGVAPGEFIGAANKRFTVAEVAKQPDRSPGAGQVVKPQPDPNSTTTRIIEGASVRDVENPDDDTDSTP